MAMRNILAAVLLTFAAGVCAEETGNVEEAAPVDKDEQRIQELSLQRDQISGEMYKVLKKIRREREAGLKLDKELREMTIEIKRQQEALEARLKEKYPDLAELMLERDELQSEYDMIREKLFKLHVKKSEILNKEKPSGKE